jgi:NADPH:quinone reductase-like Zn-dependent oxidoreductase
VGHYAVQIAKHLGAYVIGTSSAANKEFTMSLGVDEHIDYHTQVLAESVGDVDLVLECIGKQSILHSLDVIKPGGRLISILAQITEEAKEKAAKKSIDIELTSVSSNGDDMSNLAHLLGSGAIKSHISKEYAFDEMAEAHQAIESGRTIGKIVVTV